MTPWNKKIALEWAKGGLEWAAANWRKFVFRSKNMKLEGSDDLSFQLRCQGQELTTFGKREQRRSQWLYEDPFLVAETDH